MKTHSVKMDMDSRSQFPVVEQAETCSGPFVLLMFIQRSLFKTSYEGMDPLGLMTLAAFIESKGYRPGVCSCSITEAPQLFEKQMAQQSVAAVGLYCDYENRTAVESFSRFVLKKWNVPILVGGPQAFALGHDFLSASGCSVLVRGEGEFALWELLDYYLHSRGNLAAIKGISFLDGAGNLQITPEREFIRDLDSLPFPKPSHSLRSGRENFSVMTGRGCPFNCPFCYNSYRPQKTRMRSVQNVMAEIRHGLASCPEVKYIWFADDTFTLDPERVLEFCRELSLLRAERDFVWFCEAHPSTVIRWPHMIPEMIAAGLVRLQIGIETGSSSVMARYKKSTSLAQIEEVVKICRAEGLPQLCGNIIIGGGIESQETLDETWEYVDRLLGLAPGMIDISHTFFTPFPGTTMSMNPESYNLRICDPDAWTTTGDYPAVATDDLSLFQISQARKNFFRKIMKRMNELVKCGETRHRDIMQSYHLNRRYGLSSIWHTLSYTRSTFLNRRYSLLSATGACCMDDIPREVLHDWRPMRTFSLWSGINWQDEIPSIAGTTLSPLEYELILHCAGKLTLYQITRLLMDRFGSRFQNVAELSGIIITALSEFEKRNMVVFAPE
jgi:radical SAM superfamily enzyme YgiQ (UPF0313 family)